jgi:hypothetical protein
MSSITKQELKRVHFAKGEDMQVQPFFARFLESQGVETVSPGHRLDQVKQSNMTLAFPSDSDHIDACDQPRLSDRFRPPRHEPSSPVTLKFPSDNEDGGDSSGEPRRPGIPGGSIDNAVPSAPGSPWGIAGDFMRKLMRPAGNDGG